MNTHTYIQIILTHIDTPHTCVFLTKLEIHLEVALQTQAVLSSKYCECVCVHVRVCGSVHVCVFTTFANKTIMYRQIVLNTIYDKESLTLTGAVGQNERYTVYIYIAIYIYIYLSYETTIWKRNLL